MGREHRWARGRSGRISEPRDLVLRRGRDRGLARWPLLLPTDSARSFVFDILAADRGGRRGRTASSATSRGAAGVWQLLRRRRCVLFAAGDVVFDLAQRGFGQPDGYPYADVLYLLAYPCSRSRSSGSPRARYDRETAIDSVIVAVALSAVIWQWVVTPVLDSTSGATAERIVSVAYPIMDILLVVVIVHAVFTLPRWTPAAWFLFAGLAVMLVADAVYARHASPTARYTDGGPARRARGPSPTSCSRPR